MLSRRSLLASAAATGIAAISARAVARQAAPAAPLSLTGQVDPMIGTGGHGHVYPGASVPFGMVQLSPDTDNARWDASSGYYYSDTTLLGFSHTHLSGTGVGDLMDLLVMPFTGDVHLNPGTVGVPNGSHRARLDHAKETAVPGYYRLDLESGIRCELTAARRAGVHRYTFPAGQPARLLIDWRHGSQGNEATLCQVADAHLKLVGGDTLVGSRRVMQWASGRVIHFALKLSMPVSAAQFYDNDRPAAAGTTAVDGAALKAVLDFGALDSALLVKVGLSAVDIDGALANLAADVPGFDFDGTRAAATSAWDRDLARIRIETPSDADRKIFYTALYHAQMAPTLFSDADGRYRGMDSDVHRLPAGQDNYSTYSLWDTYRAWHPLMTLIAPDRAAGFARNLVDMGYESPDGPCIWPLQGIETHCMIGWHSAPVIAEALQKGLPGIDAKKAWAVYKPVAFERVAQGLVAYRTRGYIPCDLEDQSVSKTLEYAYDDWAMARIADAAGDAASAQALRARSKNYRNVFDPKMQFVRPRLPDGTWAEPFDPRGMGHNPTVWWDYTESNSWQATFLNQHDVYGHIAQFGGDAGFEAKLDALFNAPSDLPPEAPPDMSGLIGQYIHGNEPSHHIAYLYAYCGAHHKTQARIRMLLKSQYRAEPDGLAGNEDCGQMSAWYIMSALGFYPVDPVSTVYVFGSPLFPRAEIALPGGKSLTILADGVDDAHVYIKGVTWNGKPYTKSWITHAQLTGGGTLRFIMSDVPNLGFGAAPADRPPSFRLL
jgi:predicted alpha-1,2-mannosidase